jgi:hypothetical protein
MSKDERVKNQVSNDQSYLKLCGVVEPVPNDTLKSTVNGSFMVRNTIPLVLLGPLMLHFSKRLVLMKPTKIIHDNIKL